MGSLQLSSVLHSVKKYTNIFAFTINKRKTEKLKTVALVQYTLGGAFQSTKTSGLKFRQLLFIYLFIYRFVQCTGERTIGHVVPYLVHPPNPTP